MSEVHLTGMTRSRRTGAYGHLKGTTVNYAIYIRSAQDNIDSIRTQEQACRDYIARTNPDASVTIYSDSVSGPLWDRPALVQLRKDIRKKEVDRVVVYSLDRISREVRQQGLFFAMAEHGGVKVESVSQDLSADASARLSIALGKTMLELERQKIAERIRYGKLRAKRVKEELERKRLDA